jgi:hypothetical protein
MKRWYALYALIVSAACVWALYTGWWITPVEKVTGVPKTVRDNPGSYRSHYSSYHRYYGGK